MSFYYGFLLVIFILIPACTSSLPTVQDVHPLPQIDTTAEPLRIVVLDVGQGDATLIIGPSQEAVLIDAGPPESGYTSILPALSAFGVETLSLIVLSHYDADHIGGIQEVVCGDDGECGSDDDGWPSEGVWDRGTTDVPDTDLYDMYDQLVSGVRHDMQAGNRFQFGDMTIECVIVNAEIEEAGEVVQLLPDQPLTENSRSIGLLISYGEFRYWTGGDLPGGEDGLDLEYEIASLIGEVSVLHPHHHGSGESSSLYFLEMLSPQAAVISAGAGNAYGHPADAAVLRMLSLGMDVYTTHTSDTVPVSGVDVTGGPIMISAQANGEFSINGHRF